MTVAKMRECPKRERPNLRGREGVEKGVLKVQQSVEYTARGRMRREEVEEGEAYGVKKSAADGKSKKLVAG